MRLYVITSEGGKRYAIALSADKARRLAIESGIGGHKIDRRVWRDAEGKIPEFEHASRVISEEEAITLLKRAGYNLDGSEYVEPVESLAPAEAPTPAEGFKRCRICGAVKPIEEFPPRSGGGYQSYCRPCKIEYDRERRRNQKRR